MNTLNGWQTEHENITSARIGHIHVVLRAGYYMTIRAIFDKMRLMWSYEHDQKEFFPQEGDLFYFVPRFYSGE